MNSGLKKVHVNSLVAAKASDATQSAVLGPPDIWIEDDETWIWNEEVEQELEEEVCHPGEQSLHGHCVQGLVITSSSEPLQKELATACAHTHSGRNATSAVSASRSRMVHEETAVDEAASSSAPKIGVWSLAILGFFWTSGE